MTEYRAILVSNEQRVAIEHIVQHFGFERGVLPMLLADIDAAGDKPRIRWCAEHGEPAIRPSWCEGGHNAKYAPDSTETRPLSEVCRVVDAIVVPLPEQP